MELIATILVFLVGFEHLGIMFLEIFATPEKQAQTFDMPLRFTEQKEARISMANQGIYNGMLGILIFLTRWLVPVPVRFTVWLMLLLFIIIVSLFGGFTATKKVWLMQLLPALITAITMVSIVI